MLGFCLAGHSLLEAILFHRLGIVDIILQTGVANQTQFTQGNMRASYLVMTVRIVTKYGTTRDQLTTSLRCQRSASQSGSGEEGLRHWMAQRNEQAIALGCNQWSTAAQ